MKLNICRTVAAGLAMVILSGLGYAAEPAMVCSNQVMEVIVVFKTHFDIGYTDMASNIVQKYRTTMIDKALTVVDQNRNLPPAQQFAWTIPGWPMHKITEDWQGQTAERKQKVLQAFKNGRFVVHALPFSTHTETLEIEDLVRGLGFSSRLSRSAGLDLPRDAKMTDVPSHSWIMPTLLRNAGVNFLHIGCNSACSSPSVPPLFWWEGPDGSRLLTMYTAEGYGTGLVPPADWPHRTWLALIHTGDNHGPPTPDEVKKLQAEADKKLPGVKVRIGRLSDFSDAIIAEKPRLPVVRGDMPDTWIHGPMCDPAGAKIARNIRPVIASTESLQTHLRIWNIDVQNEASKIAAAYEGSLLYGEHTWGGALYWITKYGGGTKFGYGENWKKEHEEGRFKRLEESWAEHTAYIETARDFVMPVLAADMKALAGAVKCENGEKRIIVYNPLPWERSAPVSVKVSVGDFPGNSLRGREGDVASWFCNGVLQFMARVPSMGYSTYVAAGSGSKAVVSALEYNADAGTMESRFLKLTLDTDRCAVRSLVDKRTGRELVDAGSAHGFGQFLYERFSSNEVFSFVDAYLKKRTDWAVAELGKPNLPSAEQAPYRASSPRNGNLMFERTPVSLVATMNAHAGNGLPCPVTTRIILYNDQPYVDLEITLHDKPADPWPEAGWICLPFKVDLPQFRLGRQGSIVDPVKDIVPGANHHLYVVNTGVAIADSKGKGAGFCPIDHSLVSLDVPGCWKYAREFVPKKPVAYINLFNNQWTTNFRYWNSGVLTSRVRIWSIDRYDPEKSLITPSLEARYPMIAEIVDGAGGKLVANQKGLELSRKGVLVTAFGDNPDGRGTLLRVWEHAGDSGSCKITLPEGMNVGFAQPVDLRGRPIGEKIKVKRGKFKVDVRTFAPVSLVME